MNIAITLKHSRKTYELSIYPGSPVQDLKTQIQSLTNVPIARQKLLCPKLWKGSLKDDDFLPNEIKGKNRVVITLIGTAETVIEKPIEERPIFVEDMTPEEIWKMKQAALGKSIIEDDDQIDIIALQKEIGMERDDDSNKMGMYQYSRLVTGLPQHQINDLLIQRNRIDHDKNAEISSANSTELHGQVAMTLGMELRRAYVNSLAVLQNGTLVSGLDDGHVQLWCRGQMTKDARHAGASVDHVASFSSSTENVPAFATAGGGSICIWSKEDEHLKVLPSYPGTSPSSLVTGTIGAKKNIHYLAACFRITRQVNNNHFQLVPQNEAERQRREAAEMQERMIQNQLLMVSRLVKIWFYDESTGVFREDMISPDASSTEAPTITKLVNINGKLVSGDEVGGLRVFEWTFEANQQPISRREKAFMQFQLEGCSCSIACMEPLQGNLLAVSVQVAPHGQSRIHSSATPLHITDVRDVHIVDAENAIIKAVLKSSHRDTIQCICSLPDGGILTAGGKMDATVRLWDAETLSTATKNQDNSSEDATITESKQLKEPGYVFDLKVLPDSNKSGVFAIAAARYNAIKVVV